jgi:MYXO-CTERM domain-containing protein
MGAIRARLVSGLLLVLGIGGAWGAGGRALALVPPTSVIEQLEGDNGSDDSGSAPDNNDTNNNNNNNDNNGNPGGGGPGGGTPPNQHAPEPASLVTGLVGLGLLGLVGLRRRRRRACGQDGAF